MIDGRPYARVARDEDTGSGLGVNGNGGVRSLEMPPPPSACVCPFEEAARKYSFRVKPVDAQRETVCPVGEQGMSKAPTVAKAVKTHPSRRGSSLVSGELARRLASCVLEPTAESADWGT